MIQYILDRQDSRLKYQKHKKMRVGKSQKADDCGQIVLFQQKAWVEMVEKDCMCTRMKENKRRTLLNLIGVSWDDNNVDSEEIPAENHQEETGHYCTLGKKKASKYIFVFWGSHVTILSEEFITLNIIDNVCDSSLLNTVYGTIFSNPLLTKALVQGADPVSRHSSIHPHKKSFWKNYSARKIFMITSDNKKLISNSWTKDKNCLQWVDINRFGRHFDCKARKEKSIGKFEEKQVLEMPNYGNTLSPGTVNYFNIEQDMNYLSSIILKKIYPSSIKVENRHDKGFYTGKNKKTMSETFGYRDLSLITGSIKLLYYMISILLYECVRNEEEEGPRVRSYKTPGKKTLVENPEGVNYLKLKDRGIWMIRNKIFC
jgi:hypothetical protein